MSLKVLEKVGSCVVVLMRQGENRLNPEFMKAFHEVLDQAEGYKDATSLVTIGEGKCYSLGLEPELIASTGPSYLDEVQKLVARVLTFPMVTVAAVNGHMYAGGALLGLAHDYLAMRRDRGWFCLPEVKLRMPLPVSFVKLFKARIPIQHHNLAIALGQQYNGEEACNAGIVNEVCSLEELKESAIAAANRLAGEGLDRSALSAMKHDVHKDAYRALVEPVRFYEFDKQ